MHWVGNPKARGTGFTAIFAYRPNPQTLRSACNGFFMGKPPTAPAVEFTQPWAPGSQGPNLKQISHKERHIVRRAERTQERERDRAPPHRKWGRKSCKNTRFGSGLLRRSELDFVFFFDHAAWGNLSSLTRDQTHVLLHWKHTVFITGPPGRSLSCIIQIKYHYSARSGEAGEEKNTTEQGGFNQKQRQGCWERKLQRGKETRGLRRGAGGGEGTPRWDSWKAMQGTLAGSKLSGGIRDAGWDPNSPVVSARIMQLSIGRHLPGSIRTWWEGPQKPNPQTRWLLLRSFPGTKPCGLEISQGPLTRSEHNKRTMGNSCRHFPQ